MWSSLLVSLLLLKIATDDLSQMTKMFNMTRRTFQTPCCLMGARVSKLVEINNTVLKKPFSSLPILNGSTAVGDISMPKVVLLNGIYPFATSAVALEYCLKYNGEIVVVVPYQMYKGLNIGTGKPPSTWLSAVPHHLLDIRDSMEDFHHSKFVKMVAEKIDDIQRRGKLPVVVGGSKICVDFLTEGIPDIPKTSVEVVRQAEELLKQAEAAGDWEMGLAVVKEHDPKRETFPHINNWTMLRKMLERSLSLKSIGSNESASEAIKKRIPVLPGTDIRHFFITEHANSALGSIDKTCEKMISNGLMREVFELLMKGILSPDSFAVRIPAYEHTIKYLLREDWEPLDFNAYFNYAKTLMTVFRQDAKMTTVLHRSDSSALFVRLNRERSQATPGKIRIPLQKAVIPVVDEINHWFNVPRDEYKKIIQSQMLKGKTYGALMTRRSNKAKTLSYEYSIENSPDGDPEFVRFVLARMIRDGRLVLPAVREDDDGSSWVRSIYGISKGVTPRTVVDPDPKYTAQEFNIRSLEVDYIGLKNTWISRLTRDHPVRSQVQLADKLRAKFPDLKKLQNEFQELLR